MIRPDTVDKPSARARASRRSIIAGARSVATTSAPQQGQPGLYGVARLARLAVGLLGPRERAPQPQQLALLVVRHPEHRVSGRRGEMCTSLLHLRHGVRPLAAQLHDLRAVYQALASVGLEVPLVSDSVPPSIPEPDPSRRCPGR